MTYLTVARESSQMQYTEFFGAVADAATQVTGDPGRRARPGAPGRRPATACSAQDDEGRMATFLSMPLRAAAGSSAPSRMSSATKNAFGEASLNTLRLVEQPAAVVINNARLAGREQPA